MGFAYFALIYGWLQGKISTFGSDLLQQAMVFATGVALALVTLWILIQGFRIVTGRSRDSMMAMVLDMSRIGVIVAAATTMAVGSVDIQVFFSEDLPRGINALVTGDNESPAANIDRNLVYTQLAMASIEAVPVPPTDTAGANAQSRAALVAMLGIAGPPMTAGAMLLMFQVALALFIGLGPLFILCLIFERTKSHFSRWLMYGLGTLFSLAVLNFMVSIVLELTYKVAAALWAATVVNAITGATAEGFTNQALQQGGIGLLMTVLLISTPPMAAAFFGGMVGQFSSVSQVMGGGGAQANASGAPGHVGYQPSFSKEGQAADKGVPPLAGTTVESRRGLAQSEADVVRPAPVPSLPPPRALKVDGGA